MCRPAGLRRPAHLEQVTDDQDGFSAAGRLVRRVCCGLSQRLPAQWSAVELKWQHAGLCLAVARLAAERLSKWHLAAAPAAQGLWVG